SEPKSAFSSEDFPDFTSPTTTKSNGSVMSRRSDCNVSSCSPERCISEASLIKPARPLSSSPLSCKYRSAIMPANYSCAVGEVRAGLAADVDLVGGAFCGGEGFGVGDG